MVWLAAVFETRPLIGRLPTTSILLLSFSALIIKGHVLTKFAVHRALMAMCCKWRNSSYLLSLLDSVWMAWLMVYLIFAVLARLSLDGLIERLWPCVVNDGIPYICSLCLIEFGLPNWALMALCRLWWNSSYSLYLLDWVWMAWLSACGPVL